MTAAKAAAPHASKSAVLDAALQVIRTKGYTATTLDDICATAGVTKAASSTISLARKT